MKGGLAAQRPPKGLAASRQRLQLCSLWWVRMSVVLLEDGSGGFLPTLLSSPTPIQPSAEKGLTFRKSFTKIKQALSTKG